MESLLAAQLEVPLLPVRLVAIGIQTHLLFFFEVHARTTRPVVVELLLWVQFRAPLFQLVSQLVENLSGLILKLRLLKELHDAFFGVRDLELGVILGLLGHLCFVLLQYIDDLLQLVFALLDVVCRL